MQYWRVNFNFGIFHWSRYRTECYNNANINGTLTVNGSTTFGAITAGAITASSLNLTGAATALSVTNNATIAGILTLSSAGGTALVVTNNGSFGNNLTVGNNITATNNITAGNNLNVNGAGTALTVSNNALVQGNLTVNGTLTAGTVSFTSSSVNSLSVTGAATALTVTNSASVGNTLTSGKLVTNGTGTTLTVANDASVGGNITVTGSTTTTGITSTTGTFSTDVGITGFLKVGLQSSPGRLKFATSSTDYTLIGVDSSDDATNTRIIISGSTRAGTPGGIQYVSVGAGSVHQFLGNGSVVTSSILQAGSITLSATGTALAVTNNATIGGTLLVTGTATSSTAFLTNAGTSAGTGIAHYRLQNGGLDRWSIGLANAESTGNAGSDFKLLNYTDAGAVIGTVLQVTRSTGLCIFNNGLTVSSGATALGGTTTGTLSAASLSVSGTTTLTGALAANGGFSASSALISQASGVGLSVTAGVNIGGTLSVSGAGNALQVTNNGTIGGSLGILGAGTALVVTNNASMAALTLTSTGGSALSITSSAVNAVVCNGGASFSNIVGVGSLSSVGTVTAGGFDFKLGSTDQTTRGNSGSSRALVKDTGSVLALNFGGDFTGGVRIDSGVTAPLFIKSGTSTAAGATGTVTFATAFATTPTVVAVVDGNPINCTVGVSSITTTGFNYTKNGLNTTSNFYWIATTAGNV